MGIMTSGRTRGRWARRVALSLTTILASGLAVPAFGQSSPHPNLDANGVDLTTGVYSLQLPVASIGSGQAELPLTMIDGQLDNWANMSVVVSSVSGVNHYAVYLGLQYDNFVSGSAASTRGTGATFDETTGIYRTLEGVEVTFGDPTTPYGGASNLCDPYNATNCTMLPLSISGRNGMEVDFDWTIHAGCVPDVPLGSDPPPDCHFDWRLNSVFNSAGYSINWTYASASLGPDWFRRTSAALENGGTAVSTASYATPSSGVYTVTAPGGGVWRITGGAGLPVTALRRPSAGSDTTTISYSSGKVTSVTRDGITTGYSYSVSGSTATMVVTDAQSHVTTVVSDLTKFRPTSVTDALSHATSYTYDSVGRPTEVSYPEGNKVQYTYDSRGNVTETRLKAKSGSGLSDIVATATFAASCTSTPWCNEPDTTTDPLGNVTDYAYDGTTGLPTSVTAPAATSGIGVKRAQTRYSYTANGSGVDLLTGVSQCQTGDAPACVGTADEVKGTIAYDGNLNKTSVTTASGDTPSSLSATTAYTYSAAGDVLTVDGPLSGSDDTTTYRYDADRRRVGVISADPDGISNPMKRLAVKTTYNADGRATVIEDGNVDGTSNTDWSSFTSLQQKTITYDGNGFKTREVLTASSIIYRVADYSYDAVGRSECTALRMNSAVWGSAYAACSLNTTGSYGADRISKTTYDAVGRAIKIQSGYGVSGVQADDATVTYTNNGQTATATDAEGNKTSYTYDGFDRLTKTQYPSTTKGAGTSSSTDYEELVLNAGSQVTSRRLRGYSGDSTKHIDYIYDNLGRLTTKDLPNGEPDVAYTYDLLGRMTGASQTSNALTFTYDALGRNLTQGGPSGTMSYQYDPAGRRKRMDWPDASPGFYVTYDHLVTGEVSAIRENGSASGLGVLATYAYDNLGRRTKLTYGNGTVTDYGYDNISRLTSLALDLDGTTIATNDTTTTFSYSPANAITSQTRTNDLYFWDGHTNLGRSYTSNGLNQYSAAGTATLGYDARGNVTSSTVGMATDSFSYSSENLLTSATVAGVSASYEYDPMLRLSKHIIASPTAQSFLYDGADLVALYSNTGLMNKRFVFGPGADAPIVVYNGSGIGAGARSFLHADERGSIVATSNESGVKTAIYSYDEYGIPSAGNSSRFQYTGQAWMPQLGMYYYKARIYSPTLGRFMQTDPIGYGDGMNMYAYVGNNPISSADPSGLDCAEIVTAHGGDCGASAAARKFVNQEIMRNGGGDFNSLYGDVYSYLTGQSSFSNLQSSFSAFKAGELLVTATEIPTVAEILNWLLNGTEITEFGRRLETGDLGVTSGGTISFTGWIWKKKAESRLYIDIEWIHGSKDNSGIIMQGMSAALATAQRLHLSEIVITATASPELQDFMSSMAAVGWRGHALAYFTSGSQETLIIQTARNW